jgi:DHA1 family tetracycline resistance protein-like MFS transporter
MKANQARLIFLFVTATLDMIGVGLIIPSLPDVVRRFVLEEHLVSEYFGYFISAYALMQFVASPLLGALSDLYGRRPVLLISLFMAGIDYIFMAFAPTLPLLFIGRMISGLTGASITVCMAYVADISTDDNRSSNYGLIGAAFGLGFIIGPALGGFLGGAFGPQAPFLAAAALNILNFLFGLFVLPESFPKEKRRALQLRKLNPLLTLKKIFTSPLILSFALVHFLIQLAGLTHPSIWTIYTEHRFNWNTTQVGLSLTLVGVLVAISQGWFTRIVIPRLGEYKTVMYCAFGNVIAFSLYASAYEGWMLYIVIVFSALFFVGQPALQSLATKVVPLDEQGEFQGSLVSLTSLAAIINPLIVSQLFAHFTDKKGLYLPGIPYFFAAFISLIAGIVILKTTKAKTV